MAKTLTIAGVDFLPQYKTGSAVITEIVQNKANRMSMVINVLSGQAIPREGSEVVFKDGARFLFGGYISKVELSEIGIGQLFSCNVEVSDYSYIFNNKVARKSYENHTLKYIVEDLLDTYVDAAYGYDTTNVATGPTIDSINFDHVSIRKAFEKLQKLTGYVWFVDYEKNLFFQTVTATNAPEDITDASENHESLKISYDTSQVRNAVIVIGNSEGEQSANTEVETFTGDGVARSWELQSKPSAVATIKVNTVSKQFSLDVNERDTDDFVYSFTGQSFKVSSSGAIPGVGDDIEITYYPRVPIITREIDSESIAFFAALDGGDGVYEYTIKEASITTKEEATARALEELSQYGNPLVNGQFTTRTGLLQAGSIFSAGQAITVNSPVNGIDTDTVFLIQEVRIQMVEDGTDTEYIYNVRFGGRKVGVTEFLEGLASEEGEVTNSDIVVTLETTTDLVVLDEAAPTKTIVATSGQHFKYGGSGSPTGKYGLSEYT
jgi:prophage tail gpP-like protein